jgi:TonB-dependent starch-binding outer membrane protein SusC
MNFTVPGTARVNARGFRQLLRVMRITAILLLMCCLHTAAKTHSQMVTLNCKNIPIEQVFDAIEKQTGFTVVYDYTLLKEGEPVNIDVKNSALPAVMDILLKDRGLNYYIENTTLVVEKRKKGASVSTILFNELPPITVSGKIINENGEPVVASIIIKGTNRGVTSNGDGSFQIIDVEENAVLIISAANIENREINIAGKVNVGNISVVTKVESMNEVIINKGYYTEKQRNTVGNVGKVSGEEIEKQPVSNPILALQGRVAGLYISQSGGTPGSQPTIQLRGRNSIRNEGNDVLYIIDGVPYPAVPFTAGGVGPGGINISPLQSINPSDIASIDILKDGDATAIYGSRGANGVILITTKKGIAGKPVVNMNVYAGAGTAKEIELLNTTQYLEMRREAFANDGAVPGFSDFDINGKWDTSRYTNWQKVLLGNSASIKDAQLSVSGGDNNTKYRAGLGYHKETTVMPGDFSDDKLSFHFSFSNASANKKFNILFSGSYLFNNNKLPTDNMRNYIGLAPDAPSVYAADGTLNWEDETFYNPFGALRKRTASKTNNIISGLELSYEIIPGLFIKDRAGINLINFEQQAFQPQSAIFPSYKSFVPNSTNFATRKTETWINEPQLNYSLNIDNGKLDITTGATFQQTRLNNLYQVASGFANEQLMNNIAAAASIDYTSTINSQYRYNAIFGRASFQWREKYLINVTARRDGSSRFGPNKRIANFGAAGLGWIFSQEKYFKNISWFSFGKIRASYGTAGSDQIGDYGYLNLYSPSPSRYLGVRVLAPVQLFNPDYSWESNRKFETGLELGFLNDRILVNTSFYVNRSSNQLVGQPLPSTTGFTSIISNLPALVQNSGVEMLLNVTPIKTKNFSWNSSFNITAPQNKLIAYPGIEGSDFANIYEVGKSLFISRLLHFTAVDPTTGLYRFQDINNDNSINYPTDIQGLKQKTQFFYGGFLNEFRYKGFELSLHVQFAKQNGPNYLDVFATPGQFYSISGNQPVEVLQRWRKPGDITNIQQFTQGYGDAYLSSIYGGYLSDYSIVDASFVRLKNVSLSYAFSKSQIRYPAIKVYLQGQNLATLTNYNVLDPESRNIGIPPLKMITAGVQITL